MKPLTRREMLNQTSLLGSPLVLGSAAALDAPQAAQKPEPGRKLKVIVTGGHPGDPEYGCGGTIARYTDLGHEVVLLYLNRGEWPPSARGEDGAARVAEARKACEILKARPLFAGQLNSKAIVDPAHYD